LNNDKARQRLLWIAVAGGVLLAGLLFVSMFSPSRPGVASEPVLRAGATLTPSATAETLTGNPAAEADGPSGGFSFGAGDAASLAWRLGLVAVIIAVSIAGLRWWGRKAAAPRSTTGFIRIIDTLGISNGRTIHLLALGERVIVVGATPQQLSFLSELDEEAARQLIEEAGRGADASLSNFAAELFSSMRRTPGSQIHAGISTGAERERPA
jgi:flagellar biogenesis protein FliO